MGFNYLFIFLFVSFSSHFYVINDNDKFKYKYYWYIYFINLFINIIIMSFLINDLCILFIKILYNRVDLKKKWKYYKTNNIVFLILFYYL